ncbi:MAG: TlyA family RNA methyltransferase [Deltaproteobacteria bacterium]|nr:TlyA family RNA methyltransferase [Deltaproteobacteria bacterium]
MTKNEVAGHSNQNKVSKTRIDVLLVERNLVDSRHKAQSYIMAGIVLANGHRIDKPSVQVPRDVSIHIKLAPYQWVGRGGIKLEKALKEFHIQTENKICMDVGCSTGGFCDCLLYYGASKIYAIDVGTNQLDWKIRQDKRVIVMEKTNFRYLRPSRISDPIDLCVIDVSFIGLSIILPHAVAFMKRNSDIIALIKPQFELGRNDIPRGGVIKDSKLHRKAVEKVQTLCKNLSLDIQGVIPSPISGAKGNTEFLIHVKT